MFKTLLNSPINFLPVELSVPPVEMIGKKEFSKTEILLKLKVALLADVVVGSPLSHLEFRFKSKQTEAAEIYPSTTTPLKLTSIYLFPCDPSDESEEHP